MEAWYLYVEIYISLVNKHKSKVIYKYVIRC
jgi:hypothetical protein